MVENCRDVFSFTGWLFATLGLTAIGNFLAILAVERYGAIVIAIADYSASKGRRNFSIHAPDCKSLRLLKLKVDRSKDELPAAIWQTRANIIRALQSC
jgi:hypothetical protein